MTQRWDAARSASQRKLRKHKLHGPVGPSLLLLCPDIKLSPGVNRNGRQMTGDETCFECGRHMCSCKPKRVTGVDLGHGDRGAVIHGTYADGKLTVERVEEHTPPEKPLSACYFGSRTGVAFHSYDCGRGEHRCALEVKP